MKRGFPRPQVYIEKCETKASKTVDGKYVYTDYSSKWNDKTYPIPYTAEEDSISTLNDERTRECITFKTCIACGEDVPEEKVHILTKNEILLAESGPFHEKCIRLTVKMCPHISEGSGWAVEHVEWASVKHDLAALWL